MAGSSTCCTGSDWTPVVLGTGACECLVDARIDIALGLATNCGQLGDHQITRTFEHALLAKREWFDIAQIS